MISERRKNHLWLLGAVALYAACFAVNLAGAWFEYQSATGWNLLVSLTYILFWVLFTKDARGSRGRTRTVTIVAALTLVGALCGLMMRGGGFWLLLIPAICLTPFTALPLYGLRMFVSWDMIYLLAGLVGGLWLLYLTWKKPQ